MIKTYCNYISKIDRSKSSSKLEQSFSFFKNVQTDLDSKQERKKEYQHVLLMTRFQNPQEKNLQRPKFLIKNTHTHTHTHTHTQDTLHPLLAAYLPISSSAIESIIYCRSMI
jgi:hypothetical protein